MTEKQTGDKLVRDNIFNEMLISLKHNIVDKWYPLSLDQKEGGYFTNISYNWEILPEQEKMIVTQARHVWALSKLRSFFDNKEFESFARHGYDFLKNKMWDQQYGGFYQMRSRDGKASPVCGFGDEKRTYGNAFGIYSLAALAAITKDEEILNFTKTAFNWVEDHAFDPELDGYFQFIAPDGTPFDKDSAYKTKAYDDVELGYKDQNTSIHLLEAYTELYGVWKDDKVKERLAGLLHLIQDVITTEKGYMNLFFTKDWKPISFKDAPEEIRKANYRLNHVSFGHDYETAFLLLEASHALGIENDTKTLLAAKKMADHALANGFDKEKGGFYDEAYYFAGEDKCTILKDSKNWWAQSEAINIFLMLSLIFPEEKKYSETFLKQWEYIKTYLLDYENGDWFEGGLDKEPDFKKGPKGHIWKCTYHTCRALMNCLVMLSDKNDSLYSTKEGFRHIKDEHDKFIEHWKSVAKGL